MFHVDIIAEYHLGHFHDRKLRPVELPVQVKLALVAIDHRDGPVEIVLIEAEQQVGTFLAMQSVVGQLGFDEQD